MGTQQISCEVLVPRAKQLGVFSNAFRILQDAGSEYLLDFLVYSEAEQTAMVVARLRVYGPMLPAIRERLGATMQEIQQQADTQEQVVLPLWAAETDGEVH